MNILKEDYTHVITHNPLPISKEEPRGGGGKWKAGVEQGQGARNRFLSQLNPGCPGVQT